MLVETSTASNTTLLWRGGNPDKKGRRGMPSQDDALPGRYLSRRAVARQPRFCSVFLVVRCGETRPERAMQKRPFREVPVYTPVLTPVDARAVALAVERGLIGSAAPGGIHPVARFE